MTMRFAGAALAAVMACAGLGASAERAEAYEAVFTYSGSAQAHEGDSSDCQFFCGGSGPDLNFTATFTYDSKDIRSVDIFGDPRIPLFYAYSPSFSATIAISDGFNRSYIGLFTINDNEYGFYPSAVEANVDYIDVDGYAVKSPNVLIVSYLTPTGEPFRFGQNYIDAGGFGVGSVIVDNAFLYALKPESLSVTVFGVSAVPLPASAPLFGAALLGLGALGYGMRRRSLPQAA